MSDAHVREDFLRRLNAIQSRHDDGIIAIGHRLISVVDSVEFSRLIDGAPCAAENLVQTLDGMYLHRKKDGRGNRVKLASLAPRGMTKTEIVHAVARWVEDMRRL